MVPVLVLFEQPCNKPHQACYFCSDNLDQACSTNRNLLFSVLTLSYMSTRLSEFTNAIYYKTKHNVSATVFSSLPRALDQLS